MTSFLRTLITALLVGFVASAAFIPQKPTSSASKTIMHFKFLKDMGLEKPSWLPDFGGKKEEETPEPVAVASDGESEGEGEEAETKGEE